MKFPVVQIGWTPLVSEWMKNLDTKGLKIINAKVERLKKDVMEEGKSRLGKPKTVRQVECVLNYLRVFDDVRLLFHIDRFPDKIPFCCHGILLSRILLLDHCLNQKDLFGLAGSILFSDIHYCFG